MSMDGKNDGVKDPDQSWNDADFLSFDNELYADNDAMGEMEDRRSGAPTGTFNKDELPPWMDCPHDFRHVHQLVALHNEIISFCRLMEPMPSELRERQEIFDQVKDLAKRTFIETSVQVDSFGSFATGLLLPTSDIDVVIQTGAKASIPDMRKNCDSDEIPPGANTGDEGEERNWSTDNASPLQRFAKALRDEWFNELSYFEVIENTRIPLVKFIHKKSNIAVDVSFDQPTGPPAACLMKNYMEAMPPLRPLTFVLKYFLAARGLNEPYTGGAGSFMLQLLIVAFLQHRERLSYNFRQQTVYNLGSLLMEFLKMYGLDLNSATTGISVRNDGFFFPKGAKDRKAFFWDPNRPLQLALENPLDPSLDVGKPSFRFQTIQRAFAVAYRMLLVHLSSPFEPCISILGVILPVNQEMLDRKILKKQDRPLMAKRGRSSDYDRGSQKRGRWR